MTHADLPLQSTVLSGTKPAKFMRTGSVTAVTDWCQVFITVFIGICQYDDDEESKNLQNKFTCATRNQIGVPFSKTEPLCILLQYI